MKRIPTPMLLAVGAIPLIFATAWWTVGQVLPPASAPAPAAADLRPEQVVDGVARLAARLRSGEGAKTATAADWALLARSHAALEDFQQAAQDYAQALTLEPRSAQLRADRADMLVATRDPAALVQAEAVLHEAQGIDPLNPKVLAVLGSIAWERHAFTDAAAWWTQAKAVAEPGSEFAQDLERSIEAAREHPGGTAQPLSPGKG